MVSSETEQRINLKYLVKLNKTATECFRMLTQVHGEEEHKRYCEGREDVEDDERWGCP